MPALKRGDITVSCPENGAMPSKKNACTIHEDAHNKGDLTMGTNSYNTSAYDRKTTFRPKIQTCMGMGFRVHSAGGKLDASLNCTCAFTDKTEYPCPCFSHPTALSYRHTGAPYETATVPYRIRRSDTVLIKNLKKPDSSPNAPLDSLRNECAHKKSPATDGCGACRGS